MEVVGDGIDGVVEVVVDRHEEREVGVDLGVVQGMEPATR
jgi:hypothetical protein